MDNIIQEVGGCGRFQIVHIMLTQFCNLIAVWGFYLMMFGSYEPSWECVLNSINKSSAPLSNSGIHLDSSGDAAITNSSPRALKVFHRGLSEWHSFGLDSGKKGHDQLERSDNNVTGEIVKGTCDIIHTCVETRFNNLISSTIVSEFSLICDRAWILSLLIFFQMLGIVVGAYIGRHLGELCGMKVALYGNVAVFTTSLCLAVFSGFWEMYAVFLFLIGFSCGGIFRAASSFSMEFINSGWHPLIRSLPLWSLSLSFFAIAIMVLKDWRYLHLFIAAFSGVSFIGVFWVLPSLRWLVFHEYTRKAEVVVWRIAKINAFPAPRPDILEPLSEEIENASHLPMTSSTWLYMFRDSSLRRVTLNLSYLCLSLSLCYLAIGFGIKSLSGDFYINILVSCVTEIPAVLAIYPLLQRFRSRWIITPILSLSALSCIMVSVCYYAFYRQGLVINILVFVAKASMLASLYAISISALHMYSEADSNINSELFGTVFRAAGLVAPLLIPSDYVSIGISFDIMAFLMLIAIPLVLLLPRPDESTIPILQRSMTSDYGL